MSTQPSVLILDFDGTITTKDTISVIAKSAISFHLINGEDKNATWKGIVDDYGVDYEEFLKGYAPATEDRRTVDKEIAFYRALRDVEERSFVRVGDRGIFAGISEEDWEKFGAEAVRSEEVCIRRGFAEFVREVTNRGGQWGVVSVNFSKAFIRGVLGALDSDFREVELLANQPDKNGVLKGPILRDGSAGELMTTSDAKLSSMKDFLISLGGSKINKAVYIGDSGTDIECLMGPGVIGIIMTADQNSSLMQMMQRIGVGVSHVDNFEKEKEAKEVYWARDFTEILRSPLFS